VGYLDVGDSMAQLQQQLKRLEAERDRLRETLESSKEKIPSSKACESLVSFVLQQAKEDPLMPGYEGFNPWTSAKPAKEGEGGCHECVVC